MGEHLRIVLIALFGAAGTLARYCFAGCNPGTGRRHISLGHADRKPHGLLFSGAHRAVHHEPVGHFSGLGAWHRRGILGGYNNFFQLRMGKRQKK